MDVATESDSSSSAGMHARVTGSWPSNIKSGRAFGTNRAAADAAMDEPQAAPAADANRAVVCAEAQGTFSTANMPHPPGAPVQTYTYAVICFDPATGQITDTGYDNKPLTRTFKNSHAVNTTNAINGVVN